MSEQYVEYVEGRLFALFRSQFEMCNVHEGERVAVIYDAATRPDYVTASAGALESLGATVYTIHLPGIARGDMPLPGRAKPAPVAAAPDTNGKSGAFVGNSPTSDLMAAIAPTVNMVVDLVRLHHAPGRVEALRAGARYLTVNERPDVLERCFPTQDMKRRVLNGVRLLEQSKEMHVTSPVGTDLRIGTANGTVVYQYGFADSPGRYDSWPGGFLACFPQPGQTNGRIVLDVGDMIFHFSRYIESLVPVTVEGGFIKKVEGNSLDAKLIRNYLESWDDPECYATSHCGWGLNERAQWNALQFYDKNTTQGQDGRSFYGNFMWSTGPTPYVKRFVPGHFDIPMQGCSITLDGEQIIVDGDVVHPDMRVERAGSLAAAGAH